MSTAGAAAGGEPSTGLAGGECGRVVLERSQRRRAISIEVGDDSPVAAGGTASSAIGPITTSSVPAARTSTLIERLTGECRQVLHRARLEAGNHDLTVNGDVNGGAGDAVHQRDGGCRLGVDTARKQSADGNHAAAVSTRRIMLKTLPRWT